MVVEEMKVVEEMVEEEKEVVDDGVSEEVKEVVAGLVNMVVVAESERRRIGRGFSMLESLVSRDKEMKAKMKKKDDVVV